MGTIYRAACKTCGVYRDIDKGMGGVTLTPKNRAAAIEYSEDIEKNSFRHGLLLSFLVDHASHDCRIFSEHDEMYGDDGGLIIDGVDIKEEFIDFWK